MDDFVVVSEVFVVGEAKKLLHAARDGELDRLKRSAATLAEVLGGETQAIIRNMKDRDGRRAVHQAAAGGSVQVLKYLIEELKVEIDVRDGSGAPPLTHATIEGCVAAVEYLLEMGANPELIDVSHSNPLHHASLRGHKDIVPLLLSEGMDVDLSNGKGSPLQFAAIAAKHETVKVLLDHGANPNVVLNGTFTPLYSSIHARSWQCVEALLKAGADPNGGPDGIKALDLAVEMGVIQIIKLLVEAGADPNVANIGGLKPIEVAAVKDNRPGVEILFPVTSPIPTYDDWSINGIIKHVNSKKFFEEMIHKTEEVFLEAKSRGTSAFQRKEYWRAVYWYTEALHIKPGDAAVLSNRSLCYVYTNKGDLAFEDANQCILTRPDWPKAYYRAGVALKLMNRLDDAADAFSNGLKLDPENRELLDAFRKVSLNR